MVLVTSQTVEDTKQDSKFGGSNYNLDGEGLWIEVRGLSPKVRKWMLKLIQESIKEASSSFLRRLPTPFPRSGDSRSIICFIRTPIKHDNTYRLFLAKLTQIVEHKTARYQLLRNILVAMFVATMGILFILCALTLI